MQNKLFTTFFGVIVAILMAVPFAVHAQYYYPPFYPGSYQAASVANYAYPSFVQAPIPQQPQQIVVTPAPIVVTAPAPVILPSTGFGGRTTPAQDFTLIAVSIAVIGAFILFETVKRFKQSRIA
jgi:hypothetical protein